MGYAKVAVKTRPVGHSYSCAAPLCHQTLPYSPGLVLAPSLAELLLVVQVGFVIGFSRCLRRPFPVGFVNFVGSLADDWDNDVPQPGYGVCHPIGGRMERVLVVCDSPVRLVQRRAVGVGGALQAAMSASVAATMARSGRGIAIATLPQRRRGGKGGAVAGGTLTPGPSPRGRGGADKRYALAGSRLGGQGRWGWARRGVGGQGALPPSPC